MAEEGKVVIAAQPDVFEVHDATVDAKGYQAFLAEPGRSPSRGGNTRANHSHRITIDGANYSFFALGSKKWIFAGDTVSFRWRWDASKKYRNIVPGSIVVKNKSGEEVEHGERGTKKWRTATQKPGSKRMMRE